MWWLWSAKIHVMPKSEVLRTEAVGTYGRPFVEVKLGLHNKGTPFTVVLDTPNSDQKAKAHHEIGKMKEVSFFAMVLSHLVRNSNVCFLLRRGCERSD